MAQEQDISIGKYGEMGLIQSKDKHVERKFIDIKNLNPGLENQYVWLRGRLHTSRSKGILFWSKQIVDNPCNIYNIYHLSQSVPFVGKQCFIVVRQQSYTVQGLAAVNEKISKQMIKFIAK